MTDDAYARSNTSRTDNDGKVHLNEALPLGDELVQVLHENIKFML